MISQLLSSMFGCWRTILGLWFGMHNQALHSSELIHPIWLDGCQVRCHPRCIRPMNIWWVSFIWMPSDVFNGLDYWAWRSNFAIYTTWRTRPISGFKAIFAWILRLGNMAKWLCHAKSSISSRCHPPTEVSQTFIGWLPRFFGCHP